MTRLAMIGHAVNGDLVGLGGFAQGVALVALLSAIWVLTGSTQGFRCRFVQAFAGGWLAGVFAVERQSAVELLDAFLNCHHLSHQIPHLLLQGPQHEDQLIFLPVAECC